MDRTAKKIWNAASTVLVALVVLLAVLLVIAVLLVFHIPYESYYQGGALINLFLGPATACMAVTIYSQRRLLAKHWLPVLVGCTVGVVTAMGSILLLCRLFGLDRAMTMSLPGQISAGKIVPCYTLNGVVIQNECPPHGCQHQHQRRGAERVCGRSCGFHQEQHLRHSFLHH